MLPRPGVQDAARPPEPVSPYRSVNFEYELSEWFEVLAARSRRTEADVARLRLPPGRIPFLIF
jgi:hypothetical protein